MYAPQELAVYIHWPFCKSKCPYCDFYKEIAKDIPYDELVAEYIAALEKYYAMTGERKIKSVFFGGGTPSLMRAKDVERIICRIDELWSLQNEAEITMEANPNSHYKTMFTDLKHAGINRISLGVQALNEADLRFLGRTHDINTARQCLAEIVNVFDNHSADLIYARPNQQIKAWQSELREICSYGLKHISLYQLTIEPNTVFARRNIQPLPEDEAAEMYDFTHDFLTAAGYEHYEISNFARSGYESKHNLTYWQGGDYIGIGKSAHGRIFWHNQHIAATYPFKHEVLSSRERAIELILMGLRISSGIDKNTFKQICGIEFDDCIDKEKLRYFKELKFIIEEKNHIYITNKGRLLTDKIISELCILS